MSDTLTVQDIQRRLMVDRYRRSKVCPNYTPKGWWECDVFELTEAGYFREYEIKMTLADFRADANKDKRDWKAENFNDERHGWSVRNKHKLLSEHSTEGPAEFWFVCPEGVIPIEEVPEWAGLITARLLNRDGKFRARVELAKRAPRLHNSPCDPKVIEHLNGIFYWRFHSHFTWRGQAPIDLNEVREQVGEELLV